jgi:hypothetical protein
VDPTGLEPWNIVDHDGVFTHVAKFWTQVRGILRQGGERLGLFGSRAADSNEFVRPSESVIGPVVGDTPEQVPFTTRDALETAAGVAATKGGTPASAPVGRKGVPLENAPYQPTRNADAVINGRRYTGHALDQVQNRGLLPSAVEDAIQNGRRSPDPIPGRTRNYSPDNNITVITEGDDVITVIPGRR